MRMRSADVVITAIFAVFFTLISACSSDTGEQCTENCDGEQQTETPVGGETPVTGDTPISENKPPFDPMPVPNPQPEFSTTPDDTVGNATPINPTPNGIADIPNLVADAALVGDWSTIVGTVEIAYNFHADKTCQWAVVNYQNFIVLQDCKWGMLEENGNKYLFLEEVDGTWDVHNYEQVSQDDFRIVGGWLGHESWLFNRYAVGTVTEQFPGRWFIAVWEHDINLDYKQIWDIKINGQLEVATIRKSTFDINLGLLPDVVIALTAGQWSLSQDAKIFTYQLDQDPILDGAVATGAPVSGSYPLAEMTNNSFELTGANTEILYESWTRQNLYLFRPDPYAGQYTGPSTTITIIPAGGPQYSVDVLYNGFKYQWSGQITNDSLIVDLPVDMHFLDIKTMQVEREFNGIWIKDGTPTITTYLPYILNKSSETQLTNPTAIAGGTWHYKSKYGSSNRKYTFLNDGKYFMKDGALYNYGQYQLDAANNLLTIDPVCEAPYSYLYDLVDNQMVLGYKELLGEGYNLETYHYEPLSIEKSDLITLQYNSARAIESEKSFADFPIGDRDPNYVTVPVVLTPTGSIFVNPDPNPNDVFPNAKVFTSFETYTWIKPILWCVGGSIFACDVAIFQFHPDGRVLYYSDTKWGIAEFTGQPLYADSYAWGKYTVEGDKIIMSGNTQLDFVNGRRQVRFGQTCYTGF